LAEKTYSNLQQRLGEWLEKEENPSEKSERLRESQSQATRIAEQLQQSQVRNSELAAEIDTLKSQIAKQAELNQKDRLAKESAESQSKDLMAKQTAAESDLNQLKATLQEKLRIVGDLTQIQQQIAERNVAWEEAQDQAAKLIKERDNAKDKADRLEKLLASSGSKSSGDLVKMSEQEILRIEAIDTKDWQATDVAFRNERKKYLELVRKRVQLLKDFAATSPTIRQIEGDLASHESVLRRALRQRDDADHKKFLELEQRLLTKRVGRNELVEKIGRLPNSISVIEIDQQIESLISQQSRYLEGHERAIGKRLFDLSEYISIGSIKAGENAGDLLTLDINGVEVRFRWCPAGLFEMGSPSSEPGRESDENQVRVTHLRGFWIMETECSQQLWTAIMGKMKSDWSENVGIGDDYPAYNVSYDDTVHMANKMNSILQDLGLNDFYEIRLPTEAQWEYAVRAGSKTAYCFGNEEKILGDYAWYSANSGGDNHPVGTKKPNAWGIKDGHGSLWEWCSDWYDSRLTGGTDPVGPSKGSVRVYRGGSWLFGATLCRSAHRGRGGPDYRYSYLGFRLALSSSGIPKSPE